MKRMQVQSTKTLSSTSFNLFQFSKPPPASDTGKASADQLVNTGMGDVVQLEKIADAFTGIQQLNVEGDQQADELA